MTKKERINQFIEEFKKEKLVQKNIYEHTSLSGSSTVVHPITIWKNTIEFQWKSNRDVFDKFIERMVSKHSDLFKGGYFWKTDGSCPSYIAFIFTDEFAAKQ